METKYIIAALLVAVGIGGYLLYVNGGNTQGDQDAEHEDEPVASFEIYPGDVAQKIAAGEDIVLLDVRTPEEYAEVHLQGALLLPVEELSKKTLAKIGLGESAKDKEIIMYCRSGARSKTAYGILESLGYTNIKSVAGGMIHWEEDNYPFTESGAYTGPSIVPNKESAEISKNAPRIVLDSASHDFGVIPQFGGVVSTTFVVQNQGAGNLIIGDITTSCSCTSAEISDSEIAPGGEAKLTVFFDPNFHEEPSDVFKRTVFIPTNDPNTPEAEVTIQVDIAEGK